MIFGSIDYFAMSHLFIITFTLCLDLLAWLAFPWWRGDHSEHKDKKDESHHHFKEDHLTGRIHTERRQTEEHDQTKRLREKYYDSNEKLNSMRILVIDDSSTSRQIIHRILSEAGHSIVEADCGFVGADMVQRGITAASFGSTGSGYDLLLINHVLKGTNGTQTASNMRSIGFVGIILGLMGAPPHAHELTHYMEAGANNVLVKPFSLDAFNNMLSGTITMCFQLY